MDVGERRCGDGVDLEDVAVSLMCGNAEEAVCVSLFQSYELIPNRDSASQKCYEHDVDESFSMWMKWKEPAIQRYGTDTY